MDFESTVERIKDETHRRSPDDEIYAARAIEAAIRFFRRRRFYFNEAKTGAVVLPSGTSILTRDLDGVTEPGEFPQNLLRVIAVRYKDNGSTGPWSKPLTPYTQSQEPDNVGGSKPIFYGMMLDNIELLPVTGSELAVHMAYIADIGTPYVKRGPENTWQIFINGNAVPPDYSNAWFTDAQDLTVNRACYQLFMGPYSNEEKAGRFNIMTQDNLRMIERMGANFAEVGDAQPWGQETYDVDFTTGY